MGDLPSDSSPHGDSQTLGPSPNAVHVRALASDFEVGFTDADTADRFARAWSRCLVQPAGDVARWSIGDLPVGREASLDHVLSTELTSKAIEALAGRRLMLHAVGVAAPDGRVIALIGPPGSGKTTAAVALCRGTFGYVTDETVAVDEQCSVLPFPRPLALVEGTADGAKSQRGPDELGLTSCPQSLTLSRLLVLRREPGRVEPPRLVPIALLDALLDLIPQTSALPSLDRPLQSFCRLIDVAGGVRRLEYGEADDVATTLLELLDAPIEPDQDWTALAGSSETTSARWALMDGRVRQTPVVDAVRIGDEALLFVSDTPVRLSGIGLTVWLEAASEPRVDELVDRVLAVHGPHPEAARLVRDAVEALREVHVLGHARPVTVRQFVDDLATAATPAADVHQVCCGHDAQAGHDATPPT